jgi:hypothetical protein
VHFFTIGKRSLDTAVQSAQHPDVRVHHEVPAFRGADQTSDCGLPFLKILLGLRQLHDEVGSIAQSQQLAPIQQDRIIEGASPGGSGLQCAISYPPSGMCGTLNWRSFPLLRLPHFLGRLFRFPEPLTELIQFGNLKKEIG